MITGLLKNLEHPHPRSLRHLASHLAGLVEHRLWLNVLIGMLAGLVVGGCARARRGHRRDTSSRRRHSRPGSVSRPRPSCSPAARSADRHSRRCPRAARPPACSENSELAAASDDPGAGSAGKGFGVARIDMGRNIAQRVVAGSRQELFLIDYDSEVRSIDGSARWQLNDRLVLGGRFRAYENGGSFPIEHDDMRAFVELGLSREYLLRLGYRRIDYVEDRFDDYEAELLEVALRVRWWQPAPWAAKTWRGPWTDRPSTYKHVLRQRPCLHTVLTRK